MLTCWFPGEIFASGFGAASGSVRRSLCLLGVDGWSHGWSRGVFWGFAGVGGVYDVVGGAGGGDGVGRATSGAATIWAGGLVTRLPGRGRG